MCFDKRLKELRQERNISTADLAKILGVTPRTIQHYEKGTAKPTFDSLVKLAELFDVSIDYLVGRSDKR